MIRVTIIIATTTLAPIIMITAEEVMAVTKNDMQ